MVGKSVLMAGIGVVVGLAGAVALTRLMCGLLFGVSATDPITFGGTALLLTAVAFVSSVIPAQRAVKVNPIAVLKDE